MQTKKSRQSCSNHLGQRLLTGQIIKRMRKGESWVAFNRAGEAECCEGEPRMRGYRTAGREKLKTKYRHFF